MEDVKGEREACGRWMLEAIRKEVKKLGRCERIKVKGEREKGDVSVGAL
jgi:hypothetical protein